MPRATTTRMIKYGKRWPVGWGHLEIELYCFRVGFTPEQGGLGKFQHAKNIINALWGPHNKHKHFQWHPWAERMLAAACVHQYLGLAGCGNSGKTDFAAIWAIINYLAAPKWTMVLVVSTSLKESRKRIWGSIREYWQSVPGLPGKLVDSLGLIRYELEGDASSDKCGITLVAGEKKKEQDAVGKLIGMKNRYVILIADELPELSGAILEAYKSNLSLNPNCQFLGLGNPASRYDPFGIFITPKNGWGSVNEYVDEYETQLGHCLHFDGEKSPNILAGEILYEWLLTSEKREKQESDLGGRNTMSYWRMVRGWFCPDGSDQSVFSEADLIKFKADRRVTWMRPPVKLASMDPSFTNGGDDCILQFLSWGLAVDHEFPEGKPTLELGEWMALHENVTKLDQPRTYQIAEQFRDECTKRGIPPENAAMDCTGAGAPLADVVQTIWSKKVLRVEFGGSATERPISDHDRRPAKEFYGNKVTELWYSGLQFLKAGQLAGVSPELARELCARQILTRKRGDIIVQVEGKEAMRDRIGRSPDKADAAMIGVDLVRERFKGRPARLDTQSRALAWKKLCRRYDQHSQPQTSLEPA